MRTDLTNYNVDQYTEDVETFGLKETWFSICDFVSKNSETNFLNISNFGELYEIGLAIENKDSKKSSGQYYTPEDVSSLMSEMLMDLPGDSVCDVGCGTGNLILSYLDCVGEEKARDLLNRRGVYLYDMDETALLICKTSIALRYGKKESEKLNICCGDFLDKNTILPRNCKVISNPPYAAIKQFGDNWDITQNVQQSKEFYSAFLEKIFVQSTSAVTISPFSFVSGNKFYPLRKVMCQCGYGAIYSFDNVPANIFGRKHGIFNTNHSNSVRPAITQFCKDEKKHGFRTTPLIRFKSVERKKVISYKFLESQLSSEFQIVNSQNKSFKKVDNQLTNIYDVWIKKSDCVLKDLCDARGQYMISSPNTCRYFTSASTHELSRSGQNILYFSDYNKFCYVFCLLNSSFSYWWWRIYDGAITYSRGLLDKMPCFYSLLSKDDMDYFIQTAEKLISESNEFIIRKNNVGIQENIKYPEIYRQSINSRLLYILGLDGSDTTIEKIHSNQIGGEI